MNTELLALTLTAASIGVLHTLLGPDHYLPFIAMAKARDWTTRRTVLVTVTCGVGHVLGSIILGLLGVTLGWAIGGVEAFESFRGDLAAWLLLSFGLAYTAWGLRSAYRNRPHVHLHGHGNGTVHVHRHQHHGQHVHVHEEAKVSITPWVLFVVFVFGPCEALIPVLMYPAAQGNWLGLAIVTAVFAVATLVTMTSAVLLGVKGLSGARWKRLERYSHALAGITLVACGLAMKLGL